MPHSEQLWCGNHSLLLNLISYITLHFIYHKKTVSRTTRLVRFGTVIYYVAQMPIRFYLTLLGCVLQFPVPQIKLFLRYMVQDVIF